MDFIAEWFEAIIRDECQSQIEKQILHETFMGETSKPSNKSFDPDHERNFTDSESNFNQQFPSLAFLKELLDYRKTHTEVCNMILVLIMVRYLTFLFDLVQKKMHKLFTSLALSFLVQASLHFQIPLRFTDEMLKFTNLNLIK